MKQDDILELRIEANGSDGKGIAHINGYCVFVPFAIAEEVCRVRVTFVNAKKNLAYAKLLQITTASPNRVNPACANYGECGGCSLQHLSYEAQLKQKSEAVKTNLKKIGGIETGEISIFPSPDIWGYRNKIALPVAGTSGNVKIGLYKADTHDVVGIKFGCRLCGKWEEALVDICRDWLNKTRLAPYDEKTGSGIIKHLVARYLDGQLLLTVVRQSGAKINYSTLATKLRERFKRFGLFENFNDEKNNVILSGTSKHVCGLETIESEAFSVKYFLRPDSFFQVNAKVKDELYAEVKKQASACGTEVLLDCFSGVGLLSAALYSKEYDTVAIELSPSAVADAQQLKQSNGLTRLTNICGDVLKELPKVLQANVGKVITAVVDPPRKGLASQTVEALGTSDVLTVIYISCDSATLSRDLSRFSFYGLHPTYIKCFDMFPQTANVETLVVLSR